MSNQSDQPHHDDLTRIEGIGPKVAEVLHNAGIHSFAQLAATPAERLGELLHEAGGTLHMAKPDTWPEQAQLAASGAWPELYALQHQLIGGRERANALGGGWVVQADEGEEFMRRWGQPATMKLDRINGRSQHLVVGAEALAVGKAIPMHRHDNADEILLIRAGTGVAVFDHQRVPVKEGALIYIPRGEWFSLENSGDIPLAVTYIFSELGYDSYFRATSVPKGEKVVPLSADEIQTIHAQYREFITFKADLDEDGHLH